MEGRLAVSEIFGPTLQGEGPSVGTPTIFLRLAGCDLACSFCDSAFTWNWKGTKFLHLKKFDKKKEVKVMSVSGITSTLLSIGADTKHLVISGGEPFLQQESLVPIVMQLKKLGWYIEIETNGKYIPSERITPYLDQINCSPKLPSSGFDNLHLQSIKFDSLQAIAAWGKAACFKFVVCKGSDIWEIQGIQKKTGILSSQIWLMPEGVTSESVIAHRKEVAELALKYNYKFTDRLHLHIWGSKRGY